MNRNDHIGTPWIGVDLDGTLAMYDGWKGYSHIGPPVLGMVGRVKKWLEEGRDVRIFTARVCPQNDIEQALPPIEMWCEAHLGRKLPVTCVKDFGMVELWDDRCIQVVSNKGVPIEATKESLIKLKTRSRIKELIEWLDEESDKIAMKQDGGYCSKEEWDALDSDVNHLIHVMSTLMEIEEEM